MFARFSFFFREQNTAYSEERKGEKGGKVIMPLMISIVAGVLVYILLTYEKK